MIPKRIFFFVLLLPISWLYAQTDFRPGYVITNSNDTLYGEIDYRGDMLMGQVCKFRSSERDIVSYTPYDIAAYRFIDNKYFVSREVLGKRVFLEFLIKGQVNIYYLRNEISDLYFIDKEDLPLVEIPYEESIREVRGKRLFYKTKDHLWILNQYMQDAPEVQKQIGKIQQPKHNNLVNLAEKYHYAVCTDGESCIIFEKKLPLIKVVMDVVGGMEYRHTGESSFTGGVLLNLWMPRANEKVYFRTGLLYSKYEKTTEDVYVNFEQSLVPSYKIPLMFEYIYPKSVIRPKAAYGWSLYYTEGYSCLSGYSVTCMGGVNVQLGSSASLSLEYNIDFLPKTPPLAFVPKRFFSHSFMGGFHFKF